MAEGIKILLHGWHWNFYRFGDFDMELLEKCIEENLLLLNRFRNRQIRALSSDDEIEIKELFDKFLDALKGGKRKSPVAVSKALHLLCPAFPRGAYGGCR